MEEILKRLVAFPTVTGDSQSAHELIDYVAGFVTKRGMHVERFMSDGYESLVATTVPDDKTPKVMLGVHADVVAADDEQFSIRQDGDRLYGRGVYDMKFALASYLHIIDELQGRLHQYSLGLLVTMDEEIGGANGVKKILEEGYRPSVCLLPDGGENWQIQTSSKGLYVFEVIASGITTHSSRHWQGSNPIKKLFPAMVELEQLFPDNDAPNNTISINRLKAGESITQVPDRASFTVDVRTISHAEHARLYDAIVEICSRRGLDLTIVAEGTPTFFDLNDPYISSYAKLIEQVTGIHVAGSSAIGASDARFFVPYEIPVISLYPTGGGLHSAKEWISNQAVQQFTEITKAYIEQMAFVAPTASSTAASDRPKIRSMSRHIRRIVRSYR